MSDVELLDHDGVGVRVAEFQQVAGIVEIPVGVLHNFNDGKCV